MLQDQVILVKDQINWSPIWVALSSLFFVITKVILKSTVPSTITSQGPVTTWKWLNTANSLLHSAITGVGALVCFYLYPQMAADVVSSYSLFSHALLSFSAGYFFYDFFDMLLNHRKRSSYELMVHHIFVTICFLLAVLTRYYLVYGIVSLLVEVNSIFLHWRQLLILMKLPKSTNYYRKVSLVNLGTFVVFRILTFGWMTRWLALNGNILPVAVYTLGCVAMACIVSMSIVLFFRLLRADFYSSSKEDKLRVN